MTRRISMALLLGAAFALLAGCPATPPPDLSNLADLEGTYADAGSAAGAEELAFQDAYMKTFAIEQSAGIASRGARTLLPEPGGDSSRATWPADKLPRLYSQTTGSVADYPEPGLTTTYELAAAPTVGAGVYQATVTAQYPASSIIDKYVESYYVADRSPGAATPDGWWSEADPIVDSTGAVDPTARVVMEIQFRDRSIRYETIVEFVLPAVSGPGFAAFDILGPLTFPEFSYPADDNNAAFSSIIVYQQTKPWVFDFSFWGGVEDKTLVGVRYYTEHFVSGGAQYKGTLVAYEKAISRVETTTGGSLVDALADVFVGSEHAVLAESVFRKEVLFDAPGGVVDPSAIGQNSIMRTHVVDVVDQADYQLQILNEDVLRLLDWEGPTYAIPDGEATEIEAQDPTTAVLRKETLTNPDGSAFSTIESGTTDIAALYTAIVEGASTVGVAGGAANDIDGSLDGDGVVPGYEGDIGTSHTDPAQATNAGTVEAWIYIDAHTNWGGIVHKGREINFTDEGWSLQFVSNRGDVAFAVVSQNPYDYDMAQASNRLNTRKWYYLVGTWDGSTITIYVNGVPKGSVASTRVAYNDPLDPAPIVVGSQLLDGETIGDWYGFNGKINGVKVSNTATSGPDILAFYNANKGLTANW